VKLLTIFSHNRRVDKYQSVQYSILVFVKVSDKAYYSPGNLLPNLLVNENLHFSKNKNEVKQNFFKL
jgi:hypothetical protein